MGVPLDFTFPGSFQSVNDMIGGGPFNLDPGMWTDDTSLAICLALNLGEGADTTGAIDGQLAGAYYGKNEILKKWINKLADLDLIDSFIERLWEVTNPKL